MRRFDAVIFDLGSTLIYFTGKWEEIRPKADEGLFRTLEAAGFKLDKETFLNEFRARMDQYMNHQDSEYIQYTTAYVLKNLLAEKGYPDVPGETLMNAIGARYAVTQVYWQAEADADWTLQKLKDAGYRLAIISNAADDMDVQALIDRAGIRAYFDVTTSSAARGIHKPHPRIFTDVLDILEVKPERAVMVGDTLSADIQGAHNAGMQAIWITRRVDKFANREHENSIKPDAVITSLDELPALLESWP